MLQIQRFVLLLTEYDCPFLQWPVLIHTGLTEKDFLKPFLRPQYSLPLHIQVYDHFQFGTQDPSWFGNPRSCPVGSELCPC